MPPANIWGVYPAELRNTLKTQVVVDFFRSGLATRAQPFSTAL
jgi:hypothetical protein